MQTTPNLGLSIFSSDQDQFDELLIAAAFSKIDTAWGPNGPGGLTKLWDSTEAGVAFPAASITTPALSQAYKHLLIVQQYVPSAGNPDVCLRCNGDTGAANYLWNGFIVNGGTGALSSAASAGDSKAQLTTNAALGANPTSIITRLIDYANAATKTPLNSDPGLVGYSGRSAGIYNVAAAVATLSFFLTLNSLAAGTRITVYGEA